MGSAKHFFQHARKSMEERGTVGSFTRIAKSHGRSVEEEAEHDKHKPGAIGKKARFALASESVHHKR